MFYRIVFAFILFSITVECQYSISNIERTGIINRDTLSLGSFSFGSIDTNTYVVGSGDKFFVSIIGLDEVIFNAEINREGSIYLPRIGNLFLKGETLSNAKKKIYSVLRQNYKNVDIHISLIDVRRIKVNVAGDVKKSQQIFLFANSHVSDLINKYIWLNPTSDLRNISIIRENGEKISVDYIKFLRFGEQKFNPYLLDDDFIYFDKIDRTVAAVGALKFPGVYEFVEGEDIRDFIKLCGGYLTKAKTDTIEIVRFANDNRTQNRFFLDTKDEFSTSDFKLQSGDKIIVREIPKFMVDNSVNIEGFVKFPGPYKIKDDTTTLKELIDLSGGFQENASLKDAFVFREIGSDEYDPEFERLKIIPRADMTDDEYDYFKSKSRHRKGKVIADFEDLFVNNNLSENITLRRNDVIRVPEMKNFITMLGQVVKPGNIPYKEEYTVDDYIKIAGGYGWRALKSDVRIVKSGTGEWIEVDDIEKLEPGDAIWVPEDPPSPRFWVVFKDVLSVAGQVATVIAATVAVVVSTR